MGKGAPAAPNPATTIQQQTASNRETAIAQTGLNLINQTDALGNKLEYSQEGTWSDGTPRFNSKQTLSAPSQALLNTGQQTQQNLANLAQEQSGRLSGLLNAPMDFSAQRGYLNELTASNLDPMWARQEEQFQQQLTNRGLRPGSTAYAQQLQDFQNNKSSAYNSANLNNYNSALQSQIAIRNQPLQEIMALAGGSQLQTPQFGTTPQTGVAGTDVAGITNAGYQQQMAGYNAGQQQLGGLFSAGASLIPLLSDRRAKTDIVRIGQTDAGTPIYKFRYKHGGPVQIGYMAQDLIETQPNAVTMGPDGFYRVNYDEVA